MTLTIEERALDTTAKMLGIEPDKIKREATFAEDLGADSLDRVELTMAFEEEFNLEIPDADAEELQTFGQAVDYLTRRMGGGEEA